MNNGIVIFTSERSSNLKRIKFSNIEYFFLKARFINLNQITSRYLYPFYLNLKNINLLYKKIQKKDFDVFIINGIPFDLSIISIVLLILRKIPFITIHHISLNHSHKITRKFITVIRKLFLDKLLFNSKFIICVDPLTMTEAQNIWGNRYGGNRIKLIPPYFISTKFIAFSEQKNQAVGGRILSLGHITPWRSRFRLIPIIEKCFELDIISHTSIVGNIQDDTLKNYCLTSPWKSKIEFHGQLDHESLLELLDDTLVEIHDLEGLGFGVATIEMMSAGVPVICVVPSSFNLIYNLGDFKNLLFFTDIDYNHLVKCISKLKFDILYRNKVINEQFRFVTKFFSPDTILDQYYSILKRIDHRFE